MIFRRFWGIVLGKILDDVKNGSSMVPVFV